jgi:hypothetical protein
MNLRKKKVDVLVPPDTASDNAKLKAAPKKKKKAGGVFPNLKPDDHHRASVPAPPVKDAAVGRANVTGGRETR